MNEAKSESLCENWRTIFDQVINHWEIDYGDLIAQDKKNSKNLESECVDVAEQLPEIISRLMRNVEIETVKVPILHLYLWFNAFPNMFPKYFRKSLRVYYKQFPDVGFFLSDRGARRYIMKDKWKTAYIERKKLVCNNKILRLPTIASLERGYWILQNCDLNSSLYSRFFLAYYVVKLQSFKFLKKVSLKIGVEIMLNQSTLNLMELFTFSLLEQFLDSPNQFFLPGKENLDSPYFCSRINTFSCGNTSDLLVIRNALDETRCKYDYNTVFEKITLKSNPNELSKQLKDLGPIWKKQCNRLRLLNFLKNLFRNLPNFYFWMEGCAEKDAEAALIAIECYENKTLNLKYIKFLDFVQFKNFPRVKQALQRFSSKSILCVYISLFKDAKSLGEFFSDLVRALGHKTQQQEGLIKWTSTVKVDIFLLLEKYDVKPCEMNIKCFFVATKVICQ